MWSDELDEVIKRKKHGYHQENETMRGIIKPSLGQKHLLGGLVLSHGIDTYVSNLEYNFQGRQISADKMFHLGRRNGIAAVFMC